MISFNFVEDYLEVIAGKKPLHGATSAPGHFWLGPAFAPIINLARYDNNFLDSVTDATLAGSALTDRQSELAIKLINKYTRQLGGHGISVYDMSNPRYRKPLRIIDRTQVLEFDGDTLIFKFPYNNTLIEQIRDMVKESHGRIQFDRDARVWKVAPTEYNVNWAYSFAKANNFQIAPEVQEFMDAILACESVPHVICLRPDMQIENASQSLVDYINQNLGGFDDSNLIRLIDNAPILGYTVDEQILDAVKQITSGSNVLLLSNREYNFNNAQDAIERIIDYATVADRWPVFVFNPTPESTEAEWAKLVGEENMLVVGNKKWNSDSVEPHHRVVYSHKPIKHFNRIPILVSHAGMMIGFEKQAMTLAAEKIFFTGVKLKT